MTVSILFCDGFDHYNNATDLATVYADVQGFSTFAAGRINGKSIELATAANNYLQYQNFSPQSDLTVGFAVNVQGGGYEGPIFAFGDVYSGAELLHADFSTENLAKITVNGIATQYTIPILPQNNWTQIQFRLVVGTAGSYECIFNGNTVAFSASGVNTTANSGSITATNQIKFYPSPNSPNFIDDFVLATGGFPGDCRIQTDFPVSNHSVAFTPLANANWQEVSEVAMDGDTSYNSSSTVGAQDTFTFTTLSVPAGSTILGVSLVNASRKTDAGARTVENVVLSGSASANGANFGPSTSYEYQYDQFLTDPATGVAWTQSGINAAFFGYKVAS